MRVTLLTLITAVGLVSQANAQTTVYRCGSQFSDAPCPGAVTLALAPAPRADQVLEARAVAQREQQFADRLHRERLRDEREAGRRNVMGGIAAGPRTRLPDAGPAKPGPARRDKKNKGALGAFADDSKVTLVIEQRAPKKTARR